MVGIMPLLRRSDANSRSNVRPATGVPDIFVGRYFRERIFSREDIFAGRYFRVKSTFAKISSRENISNSLFAKFSSRENKVLYSTRIAVLQNCIGIAIYSNVRPPPPPYLILCILCGITN